MLRRREAAASASAPGPRSYAELNRREVVLTLAGVLLAMLLAALDQTIVGTAMPRIVADLEGFEQYAWVTTAYMVTSTTVVPIVGKLSDLYGRKRFYLAGLVVFLVGSALCGAAPGMTELILFRALQGIGGGIAMAIAFIVIGDLFPPAQRGRLQGLFAGVFGLAALIGPPLGGYLTDALSWRWVFYVNIPLGFLALAVIAGFFPHIVPTRAHGGIDLAGAATLIVGAGTLLLAVSWGGREYAWSSPVVLGLFALAAAAIAAFVAIELRAREPIIPPALFRHRVILLSIIASFFVSIGMFGTILFVPLFVQAVLGASAAASGTVMLPMMVGLILASAVSGQAISRLGRYKPSALAGLTIMAGGLLLISQLDQSSSLERTGAILFVVGTGLGLTFPVFTIAVQNAAPAEMLGAATSSAQFFRQIGGTLGAAVLGAFLAGRYAGLVTLELARGGIATADLAGQDVMNPQALLDQAGTGGLSLMGPVATAVRTALQSTLQEIYLIGALAVLVALAAALLLPEVPLRRGRHAGRSHEVEAAAA